MSALPPKADMCGATRDVRYGPKEDIAPDKARRLHASIGSAGLIEINACPRELANVFAILDGAGHGKMWIVKRG
jgi:hypothetical protein